MVDISIILPTMNSAKFISCALDSIERQSFQNWELLICDNNSTDQTLSVVNERIKKNKRIKIVSFSDRGVAHALNKGFSLANGEILTWLNSDDLYYSNDALELVEKFLNNQKRSDYLVGDFFNIDESGKKIKSFISYIPNGKLKNKFFINQIFTGSLFFKKNCFIKFNNFNTKYKYAFEYELLSFLTKNYYGCHVNKFLSCFRITKNQLSSNKEELNREFFEILNHYDLKYSNSKILRIKSYLLQGSLIRFLYYKLIDFFKN